MKDYLKESNGFLDCVSTLGFECAGTYNSYRVCQGEIYNFNLKQYKDAYDAICEEKNRQASYAEFLDWMDANVLRSDLNIETELENYRKYREEKEREKAERERAITLALKTYAAEYENACDCLYYGYGYYYWRKNNNRIVSDEEAKIVWKAAFDKMANS